MLTTPPALPPPPPPRRPARRPWFALATAAVVALAAFASGVAVGRAGDDDDDDQARPLPTTVVSTTTTTAPVTTTSPPVDSGPTTVPPPGPPVPVTDLASALFPSDLPALRATLDQFGFPDWWPMPAALAPRSAEFSTVQRISAIDTVYEPGTIDASGNSEFRTEWLVDLPDVTAAEAAFVPLIPADRYDIEAGVANKDTTVDNGITELVFSFPGLDESVDDSIYLSISDGVNVGTGERVGTVVNMTFTVYDYERPDPVPLGDAPGKQFFALAPAAPEMEWNKTEFTVQGGLNPFGPVVPTGTYAATWRLDGRDFDAAIAFLSDATNFAGDLKLVSTGRFSSDDELWQQPMGYQGLVGDYKILTAPPGENTYVNLEFPLD